jgi:hypothetical protein
MPHIFQPIDSKLKKGKIQKARHHPVIDPLGAVDVNL